MTDLVPYRQPLAAVDSWAGVLADVADLALKISGTSFVPKPLRGKPPEIAACILTGREIGIGPMEALTRIDVIDGTPTMSAELMRSLIFRAGHELRYPTATNRKVIVEGRRAGSDSWTSVEWTIEDAQRAGIAGKSNWRTYPRAMLTARATAELARMLFPDALGGVAHLADEVEPAEVTTVTRTRRAVEAPPDSDDSDDSDNNPDALTEAEAVAADVLGAAPLPLATPGQVRAIATYLTSLGIKARPDRLAWLSDRIGRTLGSSKELTRAEASQLLDDTFRQGDQ